MPTIDEVMDEASTQTGLTDFGDDSFREGLEILLTALRDEARLNDRGQAFLYPRIVGCLAQRLQVEDWYRRHPEIDDVSLTAPLIGLGLPRTGSTALSMLLAQDPDARYLRRWESSQPCPPPSTVRGVDPRIPADKGEMVGTRYHVPGDTHGPMECHELMALDFKSHLFQSFAQIPSYSSWLIGSADLTSTYRYQRRVMKLLQWGEPQRPWRLKCPSHVLWLDALDAVFPDATFVMTHRDPTDVILSVADLYADIIGSFTDDMDRKYIGWLNVEHWSHGMERALTFRAAGADHRFYDIDFLAMQDDPVGEVTGLYAWLGLPVGEVFEARMHSWWTQAATQREPSSHADPVVSASTCARCDRGSPSMSTPSTVGLLTRKSRNRMGIDLTGGIDRSREFVFAQRPDNPEMRDSVSFWVVDDRGEVGLPRIGIEAVAANWGAHDVQVNVAFPDGQVYRLRTNGASLPADDSKGRPTILGAGGLVFRCIEPFKTWTVTYAGPAVRTSSADLVEGRSDGPLVDISFDVEATMAVPPWVQGTLQADAAEQLETSIEGKLMGGARYEQLFTATGGLTIGGGAERRFAGSGLRIRRQGVRKLAGFWGHCWQSAVFPSGRAFGYIAYPPRPDGQPTFNEGYIFTGDGGLKPARAVRAPWLTRLEPLGENVSLVLETAEGSFVIAGETVFSTHDIHHNDDMYSTQALKQEMSSFPALQQAGVRYRWDGEESYGMLERSNPLEKIAK